MSCCPPSVVVNVPGIAGPNPFTSTTASFVVPAFGSSVQVFVASTVPFVLSSYFTIYDPTQGSNFGIFRVGDIGTNYLTAQLVASSIPSGTPVGNTVAAGSKVLPCGIPGISSATFTTAPITIATPGSGQHALSVVAASGFALGQTIIISDQVSAWAHATVNAINTGTSQLFITFLNYAGDSAAGNNLAAFSIVSQSGPVLSVGPLPAAITDSSGGTPSASVPAGVGISIVPLFVNLADLSNADSLTAYIPGFNFKLLSVTFAVEKAATTGAKLATLTPYINGAPTTGGVLSLTSANCTPKGALVAASTITGANTGTNAQGISITGSSVTAFIEGSGWILLKLQNTDDVTAYSSLASAVNTLIAAL